MGQRLALVSMTNQDVYYVQEADATELIECIQGRKRDVTLLFITTDAKSGAQIALSVDNVSSVVTPGGSHV